ncbi:glycosyltransferase [Paenibacillus sp. NPDC058071]|uniref:tetratricopeptide repeat-containing glycosyltransferase family 2 protein n=1 Tax=Paenibacillus sp. NPDC058071 TaxID=3346326 RepID=UPI0036D79FDF
MDSSELKPSKRLPLSLCMIVRDEEELLAACLESALPYVSEMIVADTGSIDRTLQIAERYGAVILSIEWTDHFAEARNKALAAASQPWIVVLDADERLLPQDDQLWRKLLADERRFGYYVRLTSAVGKAGSVSVVSDAVCRLFRNDPRIRFAGALHEETATAVAAIGPDALAYAPLEIRHEGYTDERMAAKNKRERNTGILESALRDQPANLLLQYAMGTECFTYGEWEQAIRWLEPLAKNTEADGGFMSDALLKLSAASLAAGKPEKAAYWAEYGIVERGFADFADLYELLAAALMEQDRAEEALLLYERAAQIGPAPVHYTSARGAGSYRTLASAGYAEERLGRWKAAALHYARAIRLNSDYVPAWERLAMLAVLEVGLRPLFVSVVSETISSNGPQAAQQALGMLGDHDALAWLAEELSIPGAGDVKLASRRETRNFLTDREGAFFLPPLLQWCSQLGAQASANGEAALACRSPQAQASEQLAAGAIYAAAGKWNSAADRFADALAAAPRPWLARAAAAGLAASFTARARKAEPGMLGRDEKNGLLRLDCEKDLLLVVTSALYPFYRA